MPQAGQKTIQRLISPNGRFTTRVDFVDANTSRAFICVIGGDCMEVAAEWMDFTPQNELVLYRKGMSAAVYSVDSANRWPILQSQGNLPLAYNEYTPRFPRYALV